MAEPSSSTVRRRWAMAGSALAPLVAMVALVHGQGLPLRAIDTQAGQAVYQANCVACHQVTGDGISAAFPPLRGHVPTLLTADGGRAYLLDVILFGIYGEIIVAGRSYSGLMPSWSHLSDAQVADVINYVATAWGNDSALPVEFEAVTAEEVLRARSRALDAGLVHAQRRTLRLD